MPYLQSARTFDHVIVTRFNIPWRKPDGQISIPDDEWLKNRITLFEKFCLPSMAAQTSKNWRWVLYFGSYTKDIFRERIEHMLHRTNMQQQVILRYVDEAKQSYSDLQLLSNTDNNAPYQLTTRFDNDDAFHYQAMEKLQSFVHHTILAQPDLTQFAVNFMQGHQLSLQQSGTHTQVELFYSRQPSNPFISFAERRQSQLPLTVLHCMHTDYLLVPREGRPLMQIEEQPYWLQVLHGGNLANRLFSHSVPTHNIEFLKQYALETKDFTHNRMRFIRNFANYQQALARQKLSSIRKRLLHLNKKDFIRDESK